MLGTTSTASAAEPDYLDKSFKFNFSNFDEDDYTFAARKGSKSSMYFNNTSKLSLKVRPQADSKIGTGTSWVTVNKRGYFTADPGKKYSVANLAVENYFDGVQIRFHAHYDNIWGAEGAIKWSPDYRTENGVSHISL